MASLGRCVKKKVGGVARVVSTELLHREEMQSHASRPIGLWENQQSAPGRCRWQFWYGAALPGLASEITLGAEGAGLVLKGVLHCY